MPDNKRRPGRPKKALEPVIDPFELPYIMTAKEAARLLRDETGGKTLQDMARRGALPEGSCKQFGRSWRFFRNAFLHPDEKRLIAEKIAEMAVEEERRFREIGA